MEVRGAAGARCPERIPLGHRDSAGECEPRSRRSGANTFRRKLATTCSKGYLNTSCTSTVTPIPARLPRLREHTAAGALYVPGRRRPRQGSRRGVGGFLSSFFKLSKLYCPENQTVGHAPAPFRQRPVGRRAREVPGPLAVLAGGAWSSQAPAPPFPAPVTPRPGHATPPTTPMDPSIRPGAAAQFLGRLDFATGAFVITPPGALSRYGQH